ncbi:MAG: type I-C CRISPR-associated protein Cas8c/Csd1, partial [Rubripirellula sp.]
MIIPALSSYYERLANDPEIDIAPQGFSRQKIAFRIVVDRNGKAQIQDNREQRGKKLLPRQFIVPGWAKPSGSGLNPCFLWDNTAYALGYKPDDETPKRTLEAFEAFRTRHIELESEIDDIQFKLVCEFLRRWNPAQITELDKAAMTEIGAGFCVFKIQGEANFVHEQPAIQTWWLSQLISESASSEQSQCLVTGATQPIARLHAPKIKGVVGAQSCGAAIVSFNFDASESYGKEQGFNAPVSEQVAFQYATALNRLLDSRQRIQIGDATTVFWTEAPTEAENWLGGAFGTNASEDEGTKRKLDAILQTVRKGGMPSELGDADTDFYILGLSPNAARLSIRFWLRTTVGELLTSLGQHFRDLQIVGSERDPEFPMFWQILRETARESKDIPPLLSGALMRAALTGSEYPQALFSAVLRRIRADHRINAVRGAIIKAYLVRNGRLKTNNNKEIAMSLDPDREEASYHMGRLFAQLEKAQEDAQPGINKTIKDRFFSAASATPTSVFPRIIRLNQHHIAKLERGTKVYHERRIQEICSKFGEFPSH